MPKKPASPAKSPATKSAAKAAPAKAPAAKAPSASAPRSGDHVFLVDGSGYIFRAYHALPPLNRKSDGLQVNAVLGFCNMLWKLMRDMPPDNRPTHLAIVFDKSEVTFRNKLYPEYKAQRPPAPDDLIPQFALIREAVRAFDLPCLEQAGFEADDLIATYVREACERGATATIVSSDKDLMQLVTDCVSMYDTMKDRRIGIPEVIEKFGVPPEKVVEVQALAGDSVDNVPGVPGIGIKTAAQLITEYGDLETLLTRAPEIKQPKRREALIENADKARISKQLVQLDDRVALDVPLDDLAVHEPDSRKLIAFLKAMEFSTLTRRVAEYSQIDPSDVEADASMKSASAPAHVAATAQATSPGSSDLDLFGQGAPGKTSNAGQWEYAAEDADVTLRLWLVLKPRLSPRRWHHRLRDAGAAAGAGAGRMERRGISIDRQMLSRLSGDFAQRAAALEDEIYKLAGERFNLGSPKQLGDILFGKMGLPGGTKTKTGAMVDRRRGARGSGRRGHELPRKIVDWRQLTKLKSTYTDALPGYINPRPAACTPAYALAATTTGRLSSNEPNLQNIPSAPRRAARSAPPSSPRPGTS
jgi:5'-3' exonuclease